MCERFNTHAAFDFSGELPNYEFGSCNYDVMCIQVILVRVKWTLWAISYRISLSHFLTKTGSFLALVWQNEEERMCVRCVNHALSVFYHSHVATENYRNAVWLCKPVPHTWCTVCMHVCVFDYDLDYDYIDYVFLYAIVKILCVLSSFIHDFEGFYVCSVHSFMTSKAAS